jgi:hypothetical protein
MISKTMSAALVLAAAVGLTAAPATAATMMTTGTVQVWVIPNTSNANSPVDKIILTGVIGDYGTSTNTNKAGTPNDNGNYARVVLQHGGFEVNLTTLNKITNNAPPLMVNATNCSVVFGGSGPVTLSDGTGAYVGITGTIHMTEKFAGIGAKYTSGPKKGQCNMSNNAAALAFAGSITGIGKVSFG